MPRRNRPRGSRRGPEEPSGPPRLSGLRRQESHRDGEWIVQQLPAGPAGRTFVCPGCHQQIPSTVPHLVAWPADGPVAAGPGVEHRRHWHTPCWRARDRRR